MQTVKIELETVTPLFLSGANQQESELRVPALCGALRYMHGVSTEECPARQGLETIISLNVSCLNHVTSEECPALKGSVYF